MGQARRPAGPPPHRRAHTSGHSSRLVGAKEILIAASLRGSALARSMAGNGRHRRSAASIKVSSARIGPLGVQCLGRRGGRAKGEPWSWGLARSRSRSSSSSSSIQNYYVLLRREARHGKEPKEPRNPSCGPVRHGLLWRPWLGIRSCELRGMDQGRSSVEWQNRLFSRVLPDYCVYYSTLLLLTTNVHTHTAESSSTPVRQGTSIARRRGCTDLSFRCSRPPQLTTLY